MESIEQAYDIVKQQYADFGVDTEVALKRLEMIGISLHCWQGDDVTGFEEGATTLSGDGIQVTGNYPGRAQTVDELKQDLEMALSLIPGRHRVNLHAIYGEFGGHRVDRTEIEPCHFTGWADWARDQQLKLDFNATFFSHPMADDGFTLSNRDPIIREFWIEHSQRARQIADYFGREQGAPAIHNLWIPDGYKDFPYDRWGHRELLKNSLDTIYEIQYPPETVKDAVESKLFGIGSESYVVGSHDFYMGYALSRNLMICLDMGHFHPTESVADKLTSLLQFTDEVLLHVSRGVRWDSDHVPVVNDDLQAVAEEIVRNNLESRVYLATDFFDASINRVGAWATGARSLLKCLLIAMLEPAEKIRQAEVDGDFFTRLALMDDNRTAAVGAVWDYYCVSQESVPSFKWIEEVLSYENRVLSKRT